MKITIADGSGKVIRTLDGPRDAGLNRVQWNLSPTAAQGGGGGGGGFGFGGVPPVDPGTYQITLSVAGRTWTKPLTVLQDRWLGER